NAFWQRSCPIPRHNMVIRGERELRGERRGKGGRSLLATAAPFFFICLMFPAHARAQRVDLYGRIGAAGSTALVTDQVATSQMAELLGAPVDEEVRAIPKPGLALAAGARVAFWPSVVLGADVEYASADLEAEDGSGTRPIQDLTVLQATVGPSWAVRRALELGAVVGLIWYRADERGIFAAGSETSP